MSPEIGGPGGHASIGAATPAGPVGAGAPAERAELLRVAQQFEAMLLTQMLREMRKAGEWSKAEADGEGLGLGQEAFTETIDAELAMHLVRHKGIGLADQLLQSLDRIRGGGQAVATPGTIPIARSVAPVERLPDTGREPGAGIAHAAVTSAFGWRNDPFTGVAQFHKGVDLRAAYGEDVYAAAGGTVVFSGEQGGYGTTVVVEHADGSRTRYAHLSAATTARGASVAAGEVLGQAGRSGKATGTHLHFEVTGADGKPVSPDDWLRGR